MNWESEKHMEDNIYDIPGSWLHIEYFEALNLLFRIENSLRVFVYIILKSELKDKWSSLSITSDDEESSTINAIAKKRLAQDNNYAYLGYSINSPLLHLTSGELIRIITSDSYWKYFKKYFLGTKEIMKSKLDEIGNIRNSLAHFRPIRKGDIDLIKQNAIHTLSQVEKTIVDFISCPDVVPTNTLEDWYSQIKSISSNECSISFKQSKDENWIKLILKFQSPLIHINKINSNLYRAKALNLKPSNLLDSYKSLLSNTISLTENVPYKSIQSPEEILTEKDVKFTISRKNISENFLEIKEEINQLIEQISNEVELIKQDNLARGKFVEVINVVLNRDNSNSNLYLASKYFLTEIDNSHVEFWGSIDYVSKNFVSDSNELPWMPISISEDKSLPF